MENPDSIWQVAVIALLAGVMIGGLAYRFFGRSTRESENIQTQLEATRDEMTDYKANVNEHFNKTSELVNDLTQNYVKVYQHLAEGAHTLGDSKTFNNLLEQHPGKVSLTVDGASQASKPGAGDTIVEAAAEAPAESTGDTTETLPAESVTEVASVEAANDSAETTAMASSEEPEHPVEIPEPALDANTLDESDKSETTVAASSKMPEDGDKPDSSRTVH